MLRPGKGPGSRRAGFLPLVTGFARRSSTAPDLDHNVRPHDIVPEADFEEIATCTGVIITWFEPSRAKVLVAWAPRDRSQVLRRASGAQLFTKPRFQRSLLLALGPPWHNTVFSSLRSRLGSKRRCLAPQLGNAKVFSGHGAPWTISWLCLYA